MKQNKKIFAPAAIQAVTFNKNNVIATSGDNPPKPAESSARKPMPRIGF